MLVYFDCGVYAVAYPPVAARFGATPYFFGACLPAPMPIHIRFNQSFWEKFYTQEKGYIGKLEKKESFFSQLF